MINNFFTCPLEIKSFNKSGIIKGYASVFGVIDDHDDIIAPGAFSDTIKQDFNSVKLLWQHQIDQPIGIFTKIIEDEYGLYIEAQLLLDIDGAKEAYSLIKAGAIDALSIGYNPVDYYINKETNTRIITKINLWEISLVTFPANNYAKITALDHALIINNQSKNKEQNMISSDLTSSNSSYAWENYKSINDQRLKEIEKKGYADPLITEQLNKINRDLDDNKSRLNDLEISMSRPGKAEFSESKQLIDLPEHKAAFCSYLRKGFDKNLLEIEKKSLSAGVDIDGGYLVTSQMSKNIIKVITERSPIRQLASIETISTDSLDVIEDFDGAGAGWTSELGPISDTDTPNLGKKKIAVHELYAQPKATQKLIDDASINIESWLVAKLVDIFSIRENDSFINGDGQGKPRGILTYKAGKEWGQIEQINSGLNGNITSDAIFNLYFSLKERYSSNATFLMHRSLVQSIRMLKDKSTGQYLWSPGLSTSTPSSLLGVPVMQSSDMPAAAPESISIILADFKAGYKIVDRSGIRVLRDPFTDKPFVKFYTTKRVGGDVTNYEAIKILKLSA